jgi:tellurite resistance protein TehA-like permease
MSKSIIVFISTAGAGLLAVITMLWFKNLIKKGKQIRRRILVSVVTTIMTICGLIIGLVVDTGPFIIVYPLYMIALGVMLSLGVSLTIYRKS